QKNKIGTDDTKDYITAPFILHRTPTGRTVPQMDAFSVMSPGDSVTLYYQVDTLKKKPKNFETCKYMYYDLVLLDVLNKSEHDREFSNRERDKVIARKAVRARGPELEKLLQEKIVAYKSGELNEQITTSRTGVKYLMLEEGKGKLVKSADYIKVNYMGALLEDASVFENSFTIGDPVEILIGERKIVAGLEEFFRYTNPGTKAVVFLSPDLAYGDKSRDPIPPNSEVAFYIEVLGVK
ncbi:MAG: FKBP-type peptidyl-prolyl cis-trans isomerase, partial [Bacteroidota bacterium]